jgi:HAD superfamily hydrolase (TIGR01450 family)
VTWALDLDGVVWLAGRGIPGSADAVRRLRHHGERVVFLTNNSGPVVAGHLESLRSVGIEARAQDLATSAQAAAALLTAGTRATVVGDDGIHEALAERGIKVVAASDGPEAVVVGRTVQLDYGRLAGAASAVRRGARFIATNTDATFPTGTGDDGLMPGAGALVAFVSTAAGRQPEVAGKPHQPMADLVRSRFGALDVVAGDRPDTDGLFARRVGARFGLVLSGVTRRSDLPTCPPPALTADDLASLVDRYLQG